MKRFYLIIAAVLVFSTTYVCAGGVSAANADNFPESGCCDEYNNDSSQLVVYVEGTSLYTSCVPDGSILSIYSITGQRIGSYTVIDNYVALDEALPKGIYLVRVNNQASKITIRE